MTFSRLQKFICLIAVIVVAAFPACTRKPAGGGNGGGKKVIGFAQMSNDNPWRIAETQSIRDEAAKRGYDVIVQAPLENESFYGFADVLLRVSMPSVLGDYSYEPIDTKLDMTSGRPWKYW